MNHDDLAFLSDHLSTIDGQRPERLAEVHAGIRRARKRRVAGAVLGVGALAAAVIAAGVILPGSHNSSDGPVNQPDSPTGTPVVVPKRLVESSNPIPLAPGDYWFAVVASPRLETLEAVVDVPSGFEDGGDWYVVSADGSQFLGLWTVAGVERDACHRLRNDSFTPGSSVEDLADALVAQKSTRASVPEPVTVAGYRGMYVELAGPRDMSTCGKYPALWRKPGERGIYGGGQVDRLWILDVDGQRIVVDAAYSQPDSTVSDIDKLTSMVESLRFEPSG